MQPAACLPPSTAKPAPSHCITPPQAIWEELQETVHAVDAMVTRTPEEAGM